MRKMYFKERGQVWCIKDDRGYAVRLGKTRAEAQAALEELKAGRPVPKTDEKPRVTVQLIVDQFLDWKFKTQAKGTYDWYCLHLAGTKARPGHAFSQKFGRLSVTDLRPLDFVTWIDEEFPNASENGRLGIKRAVMACLNWAVDQAELIERNPFKKVKLMASPRSQRKAKYRPRKAYLSEEQWQKVIGSVKRDDWLHDILTFLRETGARPHEVRILENRHVVGDAWEILIPEDEAKGKEHDRTFGLTDEARAIVQRLILKHPTGKLFRNTKGKPLTKSVVCNRLDKLRKRLGFTLHAYAFRKSFTTDAIAGGMSADRLRHQLGHRSSAMIHAVYDQSAAKPGCLVDIAKEARRGIA